MAPALLWSAESKIGNKNIFCVADKKSKRNERTNVEGVNIEHGGKMGNWINASYKINPLEHTK